MAETMQFDLVSPERKVASLQVEQVQIPGMEGDFTALPNHAPFLTTLRPGVVSAKSGSDVTEYVVTGGFAEVSSTGVSVLAEEAVSRNDLNVEMIDRISSDAETALQNAVEESRMAAGQRVRDVAELRKLV